MNFRKVLAISLLLPAFLTPGAGAVGVTINSRYDHTTTLLPDGNILITGGVYNTGAVTNSVEMYDMASNTYINWAGGLGAGMERSSHTATLMSDGRVLIAGGFGSTGQPLDTLVICDPRSTVRSCAQLGGVPMFTARGGHTATLLSKGLRAGQVLLCGGQTGTAGNYSITPNCETFNPVTNSPSPAGAMLSPREGHAAVLMRSGKVFVTGGRRDSGNAWIYEPMNELYDPTADAWTPASALLQGRINHTATILNSGKVMITGGYNENVNQLYCRADPDSLNDECWNIKHDPYNTVFDAGSHGYLDGAEFFDQNGARVVLDEEVYGVMPYRVSQHSAALLPDGRWETQGGYGNIVSSFFSNAQLTSNSVIYLTPNPISYLNADISSDTTKTKIFIPLKFQLSRPVSGRLVDADAFISPTNRSTDPSFTIDTAKFYLPAVRARADGAPVGMLLGGTHQPGNFESSVQIMNATGTAVFTSQYLTSGMVPDTTKIVSSTLTIYGGPNGTPGPLYPSISNKTITGNLQAQVRITAPSVFRGITGLASVIDAQVQDSTFSISFSQAGNATFDILNPDSCDSTANTCLFSSTLTFTGMSGKISNLTTLQEGTTVTATLGSTLDAAGKLIQISLKLDYIARQVSVLDRSVNYSFTESTMIIRGMIFSNMLTYSPDTNKWGDMTDNTSYPAMNTPSFDHTSILTPAGDTAILGGRNCEFNPAVDCLRNGPGGISAPRFSTVTVTTVYIPSFRDSTGAQTWFTGQRLNSKRAFHTSTLLPDGHILTCGGSDGVIPLSTCELMDPRTKIWTPTGSMNSPRANHTATLLPNGNVLVAGGTTPSGIAVSSAEIYYPDTQRWVPTSSMSIPRQLHTATLMPDGNVLVVGGATLNSYTPTAEIYITSTAYWMTTGSMINSGGRSQHTATLLKSGNVLIAGGVNALGAMKQTQIYQYLSNTFILGPYLTFARYAHTANLLRDGNVIVIGGSTGADSTKSWEIYDGASWVAMSTITYNRANHRSVLLPNGKIMITGGEMSGVAQYIPETFDPDFRASVPQGKAASRTHHTSVLTKDNLVMNIGGWSGGQYLNTTEYAPFGISSDVNGLPAETSRTPVISSGTDSFDQAAFVTLISSISNFHGISEAAGGGAGPRNSSYSNPRVYIQQIDNPSGFMIDLSTRIYSRYVGPNNSSWETTLSTITVIMPSLAGELPHGWYNMRVAADGQFSEGYPMQVTIPKPSGSVRNLVGDPLGSTTSVTWTWANYSLIADGYAIFSSSNDVFIATAALDSPSYIQTGLAPNTAAAIKVGGYNSGGYSTSFLRSATYYTLAAAPQNLNIDAASFETVKLSWNPMGNSALTIYEVSLSKDSNFSDLNVQIPFANNYTSTSAVITALQPTIPYYFRVRARNSAGVSTDFSPYVSTVTVGSINNLVGTPQTMSAINWSWNQSYDASYYEVYDITAGTTTNLAVFVGSTALNSPLLHISNLTQMNLSTNTVYQTAVRAVLNTNYGPVRGPFSVAAPVYTLAVQPLPGVPSAISDPTMNSLTVHWIANGNPPSTTYLVGLASDVNYASFITTHTVTGISETFNGLTPNTSYYAGIVAVNGDNKPTAMLKLGYEYTSAQAPANFRSTSVSMSGVNLAWDTGANPPNTAYEIRYSTYPDLTQSIPVKNFSDRYLANTIFINGLMTATSYYFDVAAENNANTPITTARIQCVPAVFTKEGPSGAPSGSLAGTSLSGSAVTIAGILPNGRNVSLFVPAGSFTAPTPIAISSSNTNYCGGQNPGALPLVEVAIYFQNIANAKLQVPATLKLSYTSMESTPINTYLKNLVLARYTGAANDCLPLETQIAPCGPPDEFSHYCITAKLNQFSTANLDSNSAVFQLVLNQPMTSLSNVRAYPNPFYTNRGNGFVTIDRLPASAKVRIYTLSGDKVWEGTATTAGVLTWGAVNKSGVLVGSGIYLAAIDSTVGKKVLKIAVER